MKVKFCDIGQHEVSVLFHSRKADRASCCPKCYRPEQSIARKEKVSENGLNKAREVKKYVIPKFSERQKKLIHLYSVVRKQFLKDYPNCGVCGKEAKQVHHKLGRIAGRMLDTSEWLSVCESCHHEIEMRPEWAKENGYSKNRLDK